MTLAEYWNLEMPQYCALVRAHNNRIAEPE